MRGSSLARRSARLVRLWGSARPASRNGVAANRRPVRFRPVRSVVTNRGCCPGHRPIGCESVAVRAVHDARTDGGTGRAWHQDRSPRGLGVRAGGRPELQKKAFCRPSRIGRTSLASGSDGRPISIASTRNGSSSSMRPGSRPTWRRCAAGDRGDSA